LPIGKFKQPVKTIPARTPSLKIKDHVCVSVRPLDDAQSLYDKLGREKSMSAGNGEYLLVRVHFVMTTMMMMMMIMLMVMMLI
jgi:hypothetical protein